MIHKPVTETAIQLNSADGTLLHARWWRLAAGKPHAVVLLVHGIHQSCELYRPNGCSTLVFRLLREAKAEVLGLDLRGFGRSARKSCLCSQTSDYNVYGYRRTFMEDARAALAIAGARAKELGVPLIYFGHSLGGLVGAALATDLAPPPEVDAYALSAPTVKVAQPWYMVLAAKLAACLVPCTAVGQLVVKGVEGCTNNEEFANELLKAGTSLPFKARYCGASIGAIEAVRARSAHFHRPLLVMTGPPPPIEGPVGGSRGPITYDVHFAGPDELVNEVKAAGRVAAQLCTIPGAPHDLVFEPRQPNPAVSAMVKFVAGAKRFRDPNASRHARHRLD